MSVLVSDFETNNSQTECRVWGWGSVEIHDLSTYRDGNSLDSYMEYLISFPSKDLKVYFHNEKFDGEFIVIWLLQHGYKLVKERVKFSNTFTTVISEMGVWYAIDIMTESNHITIWDSYKVIPFSVKDIAKSFGMEERKGSIDYDAIRHIGHILTEEEKLYIKDDVIIVAKAMDFMIKNGDIKMTAGSNALTYYRRLVNKQEWEKLFPELDSETDAFIRKSYKGGWTYANPKYQNKEIGEGIVLDVNSLYPSRMRFCLMSYGQPKFFEGKYGGRDKLYVQRLNTCFHIKEGYLPTIQIKGMSAFLPNEFLSDSDGEIVELTLTNLDLELFLKHYHVDYIEYLDGFSFHSTMGMFDEYVDYWMEQKKNADKEGNKPMRTLSKLKMNSLYGKFAKRPTGRPKWPVLTDEGSLKLVLGEEEEQGSLYIPVGTFITSYARYYTISSAQAVYDRFLYADTDSLHLLGTDIPDNLEVDAYELGKWKHEGTFRRAYYIGAKCYIEDMKTDEKKIKDYLEENPNRSHHTDMENGYLLQITCAGLPDKNKDPVTFENFRPGLIVYGKLKPTHVTGGIMMTKTTFEIKERLRKKKNVSRETSK